MSDQNNNYMNIQVLLQNVLNTALEQEHNNEGDILQFLVNSLGGLMGSMVFNVLEWQNAEDYTDDEKIDMTVDMILDRFSEVIESLRGNSSKVTIIAQHENESKLMN